MQDPFNNEVSRSIWRVKYAGTDAAGRQETSIHQTWRRVADALASVEAHDREAWSDRFMQLFQGFRFLPGGRILAGAGSRRHVTLFNCFVMGIIEDSLDGIFSALKEGALTMQQGGGVGYDFSTLRPAGAPASHVGTHSSGPVSFMRIWDSMCDTLLSSGHRRGAMMATLRCDHPDIETFIDAKRTPGELRNFNLSVLISDAFMQAVEKDAEWRLRFPLLPGEQADSTELTAWQGYPAPIPCRIHRCVSARQLWRRITQANYETAEPGVLFIDRINRENNLHYCESITATNPCGEIPLPPYGACNLGSLNLTAYVNNPFTGSAGFDWERFRADVRLAVRLLDNVIDLSRFPLSAQQQQARATRRIGLGITGLADQLIMMGMRYGDQASQEWISKLFQTMRDTAYDASCDLVQERGAFPSLIADAYLQSAYARRLPRRIRQRIASTGIRNSHLLAIAPTGTISLLANNLSSGLEPVFDYSYQRDIRLDGGGAKSVPVEDYAYWLWRSTGQQEMPTHFVTAKEIKPSEHLVIQACIQPYIDNAISKTINVPETTELEAFSGLYEQAYSLGLKGCTTYRPNEIRGSVLTSERATLGPEACCMTD